MPLPITQGYGPGGGGGGSFGIASVTPGPSYVDIQFDQNLAALTLQAAHKEFWVLSTGGSYPITTRSIAQVAADTVRVTTDEPKNGDTYTLTLPLNGLNSSGGDIYDGAGSVNFSGVGVAPTLLSATSIDLRTVRVIWSEVVDEDDVLDTSKYSLAPSVAIVSVEQVDSTTYDITTGLQTPSTSYTMTVTGVKDLAGNPS